MAKITKISVPKKSPRKRAIYLDGRWALNCLANVVEKFGLAVGLEVSDELLAKVKGAEVQQKVLDKALAILSRRLHSTSEMRTKLTRAKYTPEQVEGTIGQLTKLGYLDDLRFSKTKAHAAAEYKKHGRRRAYVELIKAGVERETARRASEDVFDAHDSLKVARELAVKKAPSLRKLDPVVGRRRLAGMLLRRGFTYDEVKPVIDEVLGHGQGEEPPDGVNLATGELVDGAVDAPVKAGGAEAEAEAVEEVQEEVPSDWRSEILSHHQRKNEKKKSSFGRNRGGRWGGRDDRGKGTS